MWIKQQNFEHKSRQKDFSSSCEDKILSTETIGVNMGLDLMWDNLYK